VVNVGGAGMSALAAILAQMGHTVTGTDAEEAGSPDAASSVTLRTAVANSSTIPTWNRDAEFREIRERTLRASL
jgi:UDP-N-acetylmuramate-alanine ligase